MLISACLRVSKLKILKLSDSFKENFPNFYEISMEETKKAEGETCSQTSLGNIKYCNKFKVYSTTNLCVTTIPYCI